MPTPIQAELPKAHVQSDIRAIGNPEQELGRLAAVRTQLEERRERGSRLESDLAAARERANAEQARLSAVATVDDAITEAGQQIAGFEATLQQQESEVLMHERSIGLLEGRRRTMEERQAESDARAAQATVDALEHDVWSQLAEFFSPAGVPQLLIDLACPQINDILSDLLRQMGDSSVIEFCTQKTLKGGGSREGVWILVTDENSIRDIAFHSGGEQAWQRQIVRQAIGSYSVQRVAASHKVFVVDEPTAHVDLEHIPGLLGIVYGLANRFRQVWIIDHNPLDAVAHGFHFVKVNGRTSVRSSFEACREQPAIVTACMDTLVGGADMR